MTGYQSKRAAAQDKEIVTDIDGHVVRDVRKPKKAQPPQRPWVELTDESITQVIDLMPNGINGWMSDWDLYEFARAVLAKSKELNNG